jgi:flagellin
MAMSLVTNVTSLRTQRTLGATNDASAVSMRKLATGQRIYRAADDAAGLAISEGLRAQITGLARAMRNAQDGISLIRTADGALSDTTNIIRRMRDLSVQAANDGVLNPTAKDAIQQQIDRLKAELTEIANRTVFNGRRLLDGTFRDNLQVGANAGETVMVEIGVPGVSLDTAGLGLSSVDVTGSITLGSSVTPAVSDAAGVPAAGVLTIAGDYVTPGTFENSFAGLVGSVTYNGRTFDLDSVDYTGAVTATDYINRLNAAAQPFFGTTGTPFVGTAGGLIFTGDTPAVGSTVADGVALTPTYAGQSGASAALALLDNAIDTISTIRAYLGATENRLEHTVNRLGVAVENASASETRLRDTNIAEESATLAKNTIQSQSGMAMLAQSNQTPASILRLLR